MLRHTHLRRLYAASAIALTLSLTAPTAQAMPIDSVNPAVPVPVKIVRVQADDGLDARDVGIGAAAMLALVLVTSGGARAIVRRGTGAPAARV